MNGKYTPCRKHCHTAVGHVCDQVSELRLMRLSGDLGDAVDDVTCDDEDDEETIGSPSSIFL